MSPGAVTSPEVAALVAAHGSPLWIADVDRVLGNLDALRAAARDAWGDVRVAYSYKTNRLGAFVGALAEAGTAAEVVCEAEYRLARRAGVPGADIVVNGPAIPDGVFAAAARDGALVVADAPEAMDRALAAGVRRIGVRVTHPGATGAASRFGVPPAVVPDLVAAARRRGARVEVLHAHSVSTDLVGPPDPLAPLAARVRVAWPRPPAEHARLAAVLGGLAAGLGVPAVDVGGGQPGREGIGAYCEAVAAALRASGFRGTLVMEPGRALVADAVGLAATVAAARTLDDGRRLVVLDAGTNLLPGALWASPRVEAVTAAGPAVATLVTGPLCLNTDVLHPSAALPPLSPGDLVVFRGVGAYHQAQSTQFGDARPAVVARRDGAWSLARRRETLRDLVALDSDPRPRTPRDGHANRPVPQEVT